MRTIDLKRFLREVKDRHNLQKARPFCFVLGAGASKQSDIPMGGELVDRWLGDLHHDADHGGVELSKWATAANLGIKGFVYAQRAEFYGKVYAKRFQGTTDTGHAEIQSLLSGKEPSFGYSILAYILANTPHKAVITTNFDNLVADALYLYSHTAPIQCMHESLAPFISTQLDRPLVVKIHRDLLLDPRSADEEIVQLHTDWERPLTNLLNHFTPIFFGYGGNDGSLMGFLEKLLPGIPDRLYWCVRGKEGPNARVKELLDKRDGTLVSIPGFDEIMLALKEALDIPDLLPDLEERHRKRVESYQKQFSDLSKAVQTASKAPEATVDQKILGAAAIAAVKQLAKEDTPDAWVLRAQAESDKDKAEALYREALVRHPNDGNLMCALGNFLADERQQLAEAGDLIRTAYEADPENPDRVHDYGWFVLYFLNDGRQAEPLLRQIFKRRTDTLGPEHPSTLSSRMELASSLYFQGRYAEAEAEHREVLLTQEWVLGIEHRSTVRSRNNLANTLHHQGKYLEAEAEYRKVLAILERTLGAEHPETLSSRNNLAGALKAQSKYAEAEAECREVQSIQERVLGAEHPNTLMSRMNLATTLRAQGRYAEAEAEHRAVLILRERILGAEHPDTLMNQMNLANALDAQGKYAEAEAEHRAVLAIRERVLGAEHPDTLNSRGNLANALSSQGKYAEAEEGSRAVLVLRERVLGAEHPDTLTSRNNLASALSSQGKYAEAEAEHRAVLAIRERVLGAEHPDSLSSRNNLALTLHGQGKYAEAEAEHRAVLTLQERVLGAEHPDTLTSLSNLAINQERQGQLPEALALMQRAEAGRTKVLGLDHPYTQKAQRIRERIQGKMKKTKGKRRGK